MKNSGQCLCGAVTIQTDHFDPKIGACHCTMCRKWTGGPFIATDCGTNISFAGEEHITRYASSEWAERCFCSRCGSHLFYYLKPKSQYIMSVGLFENDPSTTLDHEIFIDEKPAYYNFDSDCKKMTGAEVMSSASD